MEENPEKSNEKQDTNSNQELIKVTGMYQDWFLDYASYVILERAVPAMEDGFKPVQRRIMHSMKDLDDGRYNKVANIVGHTMQYHPHGDASIGDAMVGIGQKELLIDTQGNWGNILTGDRAAAPRYIEARLSKFALEVLYNPKLTEWQLSYDGRKKEPVNLPVKFPMLLAQGAEGIAVGLSTRVLPHNFLELIDASIKHLNGKKFTLYPDFPTGGVADTSNYNDGKRGGRIRVRAKIEILDKKTLVIKEIPYGTTTSSLIDSILKANEKGKIKIKKIEDNTAAEVEIQIHLPNNISPDKTIDALYAFTYCENSIAPLGCVIIDNKPEFLGVSDILRYSTDHTLELLKSELEITLDELDEQWHFASLERIFIEKRIYRRIEEEETWEGVIETIFEGLKPHIQHLKREVTEDDIVRLTEIRIKRISKFDIDKAQQRIDALEAEIANIKHHLDNLIEYAVAYFQNLKKKYGEGKERKTELRLFEDIEASKVVIRNTKLYVNRKEGFIGTSLKKDEYVTECSDIDDIITFTASGKMMVTKVDTKTFIGKDIVYVGIFKKKDKRTIYNMIYKDGKGGASYIKRFAVTSMTRDREYDLTQGKKDSKMLYFTANPNGEAEVVTIFLRQTGSIRKLKFDVDFADILIKGRNVKGNLITKHALKRVELKEEGVSTLKPRKIWFDDIVKRLNVDARGTLLGEFKGEDRILIITQDGVVKTIKPELTTHFNDDIIVMEKWNPKKPISAIYWEPEKERYYVKRFLVEQPDKEEKFISEHENAFLEIVATDFYPQVEIEFTKQKGKDRRPNEPVNLEEFIAVKGIKALGNQLTTDKVKTINLLEPLPDDEIEEEDDTNSSSEEKNSNEVEDIGDEKTTPNNRKGDDDSEENQPKLFDD
ncbi:DNA gyrase/topoisomerase IV subunit A [Zunongwangia sp.]|uniref:DNA gyrase/topoisomerase IV subunit A n=1 Tax=Zunongwangia sp. TaxID=1965325 RepID=UPI003AA9586F